jgi:hypothetical protein
MILHQRDRREVYQPTPSFKKMLADDKNGAGKAEAKAKSAGGFLWSRELGNSQTAAIADSLLRPLSARR